MLSLGVGKLFWSVHYRTCYHMQNILYLSIREVWSSTRNLRQSYDRIKAYSLPVFSFLHDCAQVSSWFCYVDIPLRHILALPFTVIYAYCKWHIYCICINPFASRLLSIISFHSLQSIHRVLVAMLIVRNLAVSSKILLESQKPNHVVLVLIVA